MKLVIVIPAYNEEGTVSDVIKSISRNITETIKIVVINDGSTDRTLEEAKKAGADRVVSFPKNRGLAHAFRKGLEVALEMDADIIVNIDADGQYDPQEIPQLLKPIIEEKADLTLGSRFQGQIEYMPKRNRIGNALATRVTSFLSGIPLTDAQTGFRAFSREAALRLNIVADYTYVQETIIQAAIKGLKIMEVPCTFRKRKKGESRLISNFYNYTKKAGLTILRTYMSYKALRTFLTIGVIIILIGLLAGSRVLIHFFQTGRVTPYLPSAILTVALLVIGVQLIILGLIADVVSTERKIVDETLYYLKKKTR